MPPRPTLVSPSGSTSRQLTDRLLIWHAALVGEIERNDRSVEDYERSARDQLVSAERCATEAAQWLDRDVDTFLALMCCAARYAVSARVNRARSAELRR